jgi:hypothetical protein
MSNRVTTLSARAVPLLAVALLFTWARSAGATPEFPGIVVQTLDLSGITIDPPLGCTLCHATDSGGTALRPFGTLLQQYGTQPYEDSTLEQALAQVGQNEPQLIADIKAGRDPNDDDSATALPTPSYGCALGSPSSPGGAAPLVAFTSLLAFALRRRRPAASLGSRLRRAV